MSLRLASALCIGLLATLGLFWLMQAMTMSDQAGFKETSSLKMVDFVRLKRETTPQVKERSRIPEKPPETKRPPPPPMAVAQATAVKSPMPSIDMPNLDMPLQLGRLGDSALSGVQVGGGSGDGLGLTGDLIPLVRVPPRYPMRAQMRRLEGWVRLLITVNVSGAVKHVEVVDAKPHGVFDDAAIHAVRKWQFKPKIVDGQAVEQRAIQTLEFKLAR